MESAEAGGAAASAIGSNANGEAPPVDGAAAEKTAAEEVKPAVSDVVKPAPAIAPAPAPSAPASSSEAKANGSGSAESKPAVEAAAAEASNGAASLAATAGDSQGNGGAVDKEGGENGEITLDDKKKDGKEEAADTGDGDKKLDEAANDADVEMEVEAPPKEDVMVDYTDEFGRVRQMLQR